MRFFYNYLAKAMRYLVEVFSLTSNTLVTTAKDVEAIANGHAYYLKEVLDVASTEVVEVRFTVGASDKYIHMTTFFITQGEFEWWLYEDAVLTTAGTPFPSIPNRDRNSSNTSILAVDFIANTTIANANADTDITGATLLAHGKTGTDRNNGGEGNSRHEMILKAGGVYALRYQNNEAQTQYIDGLMDWYEKEIFVWNG